MQLSTNINVITNSCLFLIVKTPLSLLAKGQT